MRTSVVDVFVFRLFHILFTECSISHFFFFLSRLLRATEMEELHLKMFQRAFLFEAFNFSYSHNSIRFVYLFTIVVGWNVYVCYYYMHAYDNVVKQWQRHFINELHGSANLCVCILFSFVHSILLYFLFPSSSTKSTQFFRGCGCHTMEMM